MAWRVLDGRSHKGIRVVFKDEKIEDFRHFKGVKFSAMIWVSEDVRDKSEGWMRIGDWDSEGTWIDHASFPAESYAYVKIIME